MNQPTPVRERAATTLPLGSTVFGFTVTSKKTLAELDADAYVLHHRASGARLLYLACEDENKAFSIAFKTPPTDDTGVFHILEHSVLCGSTKFPVKEPFVDLIKSSMQTFLNAMTYPDKTVYPVASTNEQDLLNLMDVYMDAVLNPAIYTKRAIFEQEGWHYELDVPEGAPLAAGTLRYNGVVFNEMKGALSDPMSVLDDAVNRALFPDTAYACESGGDPRAIPQLTYEQFLDTHARHYNLANSYIVLYGDMEVERELAFRMSAIWVTGPARRGRACPRCRPPTRPMRRPVPLTDGAATTGEPKLPCAKTLVCGYERVEMATTPDNAVRAYVIGDAADRKRLVAADVLIDALMAPTRPPEEGHPRSRPGRQRGELHPAILQPHTLIILQNANPVARESAASSGRMPACEGGHPARAPAAIRQRGVRLASATTATPMASRRLRRARHLALRRRRRGRHAWHRVRPHLRGAQSRTRRDLLRGPAARARPRERASRARRARPRGRRRRGLARGRGRTRRGQGGHGRCRPPAHRRRRRRPA
ncbi:MAG: insulinase family protein [Collinsella intestinalis]